MTPTTNTPSAEALEYLNRVKKNPDAEIPLHLTKHIDFLISTLTTPIEKIEGLDEALRQWAEPGMTCESLHDEDMLDKIYQAATLYAQGRTQSAPEGWKLVPIEPTQAMIDAGVKDRKGRNTLEYFMTMEAYKAMLTAAPPVTAPIEKVDGLAEAVRAVTYKDETPWNMIEGLGRGRSGHVLKLIEAARLQLQRQGD